MKRKIDVLNRILAITAGTISAAIAVATITAFAVSGGNPGINYRRADPDPMKMANKSKGKDDAVDAFTDISQIRIQTRIESEDEEPSVIVVTPWFSYPAGDQQLFEELSQKERQMRGIFAGYFSSRTSRDLLDKGEVKIKEELLDEINAQLVMGKIRAVYFNDYIFIN